MTTIQIEKINDNEVLLNGPLNRDTAAGFVHVVNKLLARRDNLTVDCAKITQTDSAGVALLLDWCRRARVNQCKLNIVNFPPQMQAIIKVSHLANYFHLG